MINAMVEPEGGRSGTYDESKSMAEKLSEQISETLHQTLAKFAVRLLDDPSNGFPEAIPFLNNLLWFNAVNVNNYFSVSPAKELLRLVEILRDNSDELEFKEWVSFVALLGGKVRWVSTDLTLSFLLSNTEKYFTKTQDVIDFVRFIADVIINYDGARPNKEEWLNEISKNDCFQMPAILMIPIMVDPNVEPDNKKRSRSVYGNLELHSFRKSLINFENRINQSKT